MLQLQFIAPTELPTRGLVATTVRGGLKWDRQVTYGEEVEIWLCPKAHSGPCTYETCQFKDRATIVGKWVGPMIQIPGDVLKHEHAPSCRNYSGLFTSLKDIYGEEFGQYSTVTALYFQINDWF